jgi:APA family basic amino acid/polyamine antiporter
VALTVFAGLVPILVLLPGQTNFLGDMYAFGAILSFTIAHLSIIALRVRDPDVELVFRARPNLRIRGIDWPLFAIFGVGGTAAAWPWLVVVAQKPAARWVGLGWIALGLLTYWIYRRWVVHEPLRKTVRAPVLVLGPSLSIDYRMILVPVLRTAESEEALVAAARLATERRARVVVVAVLEVPLELPIDASLPEEERAEAVLDSAQAYLESYGVRGLTRLVRARSAGPAIVEEAERRGAELIVLGAPRKEHAVRHGRVFGRTVDYVLRTSPSRVLVVAGKRAA